MSGLYDDMVCGVPCVLWGKPRALILWGKKASFMCFTVLKVLIIQKERLINYEIKKARGDLVQRIPVCVGENCLNGNEDLKWSSSPSRENITL